MKNSATSLNLHVAGMTIENLIDTWNRHATAALPTFKESNVGFSLFKEVFQKDVSLLSSVAISCFYVTCIT